MIRSRAVSARSATASLARSGGVERGRRVSALDGAQGTLVRLHRHPVVELRSRPLDPFVGAKLVGLRSHLLARRTDGFIEDSDDDRGEHRRDVWSGGPRDRIEPAVPREPHGRCTFEPHGVALRRGHPHAVPLGGQREAGASVPRSVSDVEHEDRRVGLSFGDRGRDHPVRDPEPASEVLVAGDGVRPASQERFVHRWAWRSLACWLMSPPLPGSDVIVPHCSPAAALAKTACRCSSQSGCDGSDVESQNPSTVGCIVDTRATDGSADARRR